MLNETNMEKANGVFVIGTDTGVGKTVVSCALVRTLLLRGCAVGVMKPAETGVQAGLFGQSDAGRLMAAANVQDTLDLISPYRFHAPLAPLAAASAEVRRIDLPNIVRTYERLAERHAFLVVEGAGGLLVPMGESWSLRDLIAELGLPVVLVGRAGLGGINHALLTLECLTREGIAVLALMLNETAAAGTPLEREQVASTVTLLRPRANVPVLGPLPYEAELDRDWSGAIERLGQSRPIKDLADRTWQARPESSG